ncbi:TadE family type IV pilus minor pilin [Antrihabitans cavernicola]|uniref:Pilus assembly protein TadE n=1 Tax=Antrihabitans cavernicola TaxID=2495913 RepID=A0A5A7SED3_9NOCA|nr:TadE family type IV pilus minor pilin [Spelaeibacter cavernicola]KAA0024448.1 pilus assembly protein TadE [Spelaeibacter cavernicola]
MATVEAAIAIASIIVVVVLCLGAVVATSMHIRCVDAAREGARLAARGDDANAVPTAQHVGPNGAVVTIGTDGDFAVATVTARLPLLPLLDISARAVAAREPEAG